MTLTPKRFFSLVFFIAATMPASVSHADITGGMIESSIELPNGSVSSSVGVTATSNLLKFVGDISLATNAATETRGNTLVISGELDLQPNEAFELSYEFDVSLIGGGEVTLTTSSTTNFGGVTETLSNVETIVETGEYSFNFAELGTVATDSVSGTWTGELAFDWINAPADAELLISIPNNSIDFQISSVPEPSCSVILALFGLAALRRRTF